MQPAGYAAEPCKAVTYARIKPCGVNHSFVLQPSRCCPWGSTWLQAAGGMTSTETAMLLANRIGFFLCPPAGKQVLYAGTQPAGYAAEPCETVNYTSCHDGEILFDQLIMKPEDSVRHAL